MKNNFKNNTKANSIATSSQLCQKCYKTGHFTYECKNNQAYSYRPSRTTLFK